MQIIIAIKQTVYVLELGKLITCLEIIPWPMDLFISSI
jgi:hypothetical protein